MFPAEAKTTRACSVRAVSRRVYGAQHAHAERLHRERLVVAHARRRREVVYLVAADTEPVDDIVVYIPEQGCWGNTPRSRGRVDRIADIDAENLVPLSSRRRRQRCVPIKPTPPRTTIRFCISSGFAGVKQNLFISQTGPWRPGEATLFIVTTSIPLAFGALVE